MSTFDGARPINQDYHSMKETESTKQPVKISLSDMPVPKLKQTIDPSNHKSSAKQPLKHTITLTDGGIDKSTTIPVNQTNKEETSQSPIKSDLANNQPTDRSYNQRVVHPPISSAEDQANQKALKHITNSTITRSVNQSNNQLSNQNDLNPPSPGTSAKQLKKEQEKESDSRANNQSGTNHYESGQEPGDQAISDPINQDLWPDSPTAEPLTKLRALPLPNRLFNKLPHFISRTGSGNQAHNEMQASFLSKFINGLAPATAGTELANFGASDSMVAQSVVANGELARNDQTLVEKVQQERMKQERMAALSNSQDLAKGSSPLLKEINGVTNNKSTVGNQALSVQQAALASAIHHHRYGAHAIKHKAKVTFNALIDRLPRRAVKAFHKTKRSRSMSYNTQQLNQNIPSPGQAVKRHQAKHMPLSPASFAKRIWRGFVDFIRESIFLTHLAFLLIAQMGLFGRWIWMTIRLLIFAVFLMQAWVKIGYTVLFCHRIERSIQYGPYNRNFLDIYLPTRIKGSILKPIENNQYQREALPNPTNTTGNTAPHGDASLAAKHPVMVYVTGGAWIIGYKAWGALIGLVLRAQGYVVVSVDYRNFPQGNIEDMVIDVEQALRWVYDNIEDFGGDKKQIYLSGQSAGGQITSLLLLRNAKREAEGAFDEELEEEANGANISHLIKAHAAVAEAAAIADHAQKRIGSEDGTDTASDDDTDSDGEDLAPRRQQIMSNRKRPTPIDRTSTTEGEDSDDSEHSIDSPEASPTALMAVKSALRTGFPVSRIKGWVGISGVYAMSNRVLNHLHASGLPGGVTSAIMGGPSHLAAVDPTRIIQQPEYCNPRVTSLFPPVLLIAGSGDKSVPLSIPREYATALARAGIPVTFRCYIGATHTDPIIEHPLRGCHHLTYDVKSFLERCQNGEAQLGRDPEHPNTIHDDLGVVRCEPIKINRLTSLPFEKNGERMVNGLSVRCAAFFNPF